MIIISQWSAFLEYIFFWRQQLMDFEMVVVSFLLENACPFSLKQFA